MKWILCLVLATSLYGQDLETTLERNPFDPTRGVKDAVEPEEPGEEPVVTDDMPILDGTIIAGELKIALFTYTAEGKPQSARVRVNDKIAQYTVVEIERNTVKLSKGGPAIPVALYSGQKTARGGTKVVPKKPKNNNKVRTRKVTKPDPKDPNKGGLKRVDNPNANRRPNNNRNNNRNNRIRSNAPTNDKTGDLKRRF